MILRLPSSALSVPVLPRSNTPSSAMMAYVGCLGCQERFNIVFLASKSGQDGSKSAIIASKMPPRGSKSSQVASKSSKMPLRVPPGLEQPLKNIEKTMKFMKKTIEIKKSATCC